MVKYTLRTFRQNAVRLIIIAGLTMISVAIVAAIGSLAPRLRNAADILTAAYPEEHFYRHLFLADGIERLSYIFPGFFMLVTGLVVFMSVTRLVEVERTQTGILKTLGYTNVAILGKYAAFTGLASLVGVVSGLMLGHFVIHPVLWPPIVNELNLPATPAVFPTFGIIAAALIFVFCLAVTIGVAGTRLREQPSALLLARSPKAGGKIALERLGFIWRRLPFRYKSTFRNVFRYRVRFFMTVFSMLFSTALVFLGMALSFALEQSDPEIMSTIRPISTILVVAAVLLNALVIYNITNINIEERRREIAALKVLGYKNFEVVGYVFREIFILTVIGVLFGLPAGYFFMAFIFEYLQFGGIEYVNWYVWIITGILSFVSLAFANALLFPKIHATEMSVSLGAKD